MQKKFSMAGLAIALGLLGLIFSATTSSLKAQSFYGSMVGTVADSSGAVIPKATVTLTNIGTNDKKTTDSDAAGNFRFVSLLPAEYRVEVSAAGYKRFSRSPITVLVDSTVRLDTPMEVGAVTETVEVTTQAPLMQTDSGTLGSQVEGKQVEEMPLNGRNPMNLIALVPGVVPQGSSQGSTALNQGTHTGSAGWGNYQIGGGLAGQSAEYVDGASINMLGGNNVGLVPSQDIVQEFKVATNSVSAEFGRFAGGVVEMTSKAGSNGWHGTAYEYLRNKVFNADDFFSKHGGLDRPKWNQNQYGASLNGPIVKDKAFFMFAWEGLKARLGIASNSGVPSYNMEQGIFKTKITDPTGNCTNIAYYDASGAPTTASGAVAKSVIPTSCFDTTAKILFGMFPATDATHPDVTTLINAPVVGNDQYQFTGRVDYNLNANQRLFARYTYWNMADSSVDIYKAKIPSGNAFSQNFVHQAVLGDTYTVNPTTIVDLRLSFMQQFTNNLPPSLGIDESQFGTGWATLSKLQSFHMVPLIHVLGGDNLQGFFGPGVNSANYLDNYAFAASVVKVKGNHTFKFGGELRSMQNDGATGNHIDEGGGFMFLPFVAGDEFAGFEMGDYQSASITTAKQVEAFNNSQGYYATDTWQFNRNLTLNFGVRWELPGGINEKKDRQTVILPNVADSVTGIKVALVNTPGLYASRSALPVRKDLIAPRFGFAYRLGASTAIRGGFGLTYLPPDIMTSAMPAESPINSATTTINNTIYHGLQNPFGVASGATILEPAGRSASFINSYAGQVVSSPVSSTRYPYAQQWNFAISREFMNNWMVELGYAGSKGTHLPAMANVSLDQLGSSNYAALQTMKTAGATDAQIQAYGVAHSPYPYFQNLNDSGNYSKSTTYHSMQLKSQKRFKNGSMVMAMYTWAKMIGDTDITSGFLESHSAGITGVFGQMQDFNNPKGDRSILGYDTPHRVVVNYVLNLPFGKGQKFASSVSGIADKLISGWAVNGIASFQTGFPVGIYENNGNYLSSYFNANHIRPNVVPGCKKTVSGTPFQKYGNGNGAWFNAACYTDPGNFAFGNAPRNDGAVRSQGVNNYDFSVLKATKIHDLVDVQFRMEFFNIFNHTQFAPPGTGIGGSFYNQVGAQANQPRLIQAALRLKF